MKLVNIQRLFCTVCTLLHPGMVRKLIGIKITDDRLVGWS